MKSLHKSHRAASELAVASMFELGGLLAGAMDRGLADQGLTRPRAEIIWRLHHMGPVTQRELSEVLRCTPRNVTGLVDALESAGLVERKAHPTDRRATLVTLTERGTTLALQWQAGYRRLAGRLFGDVPPEEVARFVESLDVVLGRLRNDRDLAPLKAPRQQAPRRPRPTHEGGSSGSTRSRHLRE